jgi:two-component system nitrate/nitrite response regulator NarL
MTDRIRLFLVDDHALFREGLARLLESDGRLEVCGRSGSVRQAANAIAESHPDVVILDVDLGDERGLDLLPLLREQESDAKVLVVTAGVSDREAVELVRRGVSGIFHKNKPPDQLQAAIRQVAAGEVYLERDYLKPLFETVDSTHGSDRPDLSPREIQVLRLIFQGMANKEIGERLNLAESTVKAALRALFEKLGVRTRSQLVRVAIEHYRDQL